MPWKAIRKEKGRIWWKVTDSSLRLSCWRRPVGGKYYNTCTCTGRSWTASSLFLAKCHQLFSDLCPFQVSGGEWVRPPGWETEGKWEMASLYCSHYHSFASVATFLQSDFSMNLRAFRCLCVHAGGWKTAGRAISHPSLPLATGILCKWCKLCFRYFQSV